MNTINQSKVVARAAVHMAISENRETEHQLKEKYAEAGIKTAAIDIGGDFLKSMNKMVE